MRTPAHGEHASQAIKDQICEMALGLLEEHLSHCVAQALAAGGAEADAKVKEASVAIARLVRS